MHRPKFVGGDVQELLSHETRVMIAGAPTTQTAVIEAFILANVLIPGTLKH